MLHLDDWEHCEELSSDPSERKLYLGIPKSKNIEYKVEHPVFSKDKMENIISYIDQFPEPKNMKQGYFYKNYQML